MGASDDAKKLLKQSRQQLAQYNIDIEENMSALDLQPFELSVRQLCDAVMQLPKEEAKQTYAPALEELSTGLASLTKRLEEKRDSLQNQIEHSHYNEKAQVAYRTASHLAKPKQSESENNGN